jgi:hypothetical protein
MKRTLVLFLVCFSAAASAQQFPFEFWHEGKIVLETSDTLRGLVKYDLQNDLLQLKIFFEIFDQSAKRYRQFYSLPYSQNNTYNTPTFFELVAEGKLTVLTREKLEYRTVSTGFYYYGNYTRLVLVNTYFLLKPNGKIEQINNPRRRDWLDLMKNKEDDVMAFAKENRLDFDDKFELTRIIEYYNSL